MPVSPGLAPELVAEADEAVGALPLLGTADVTSEGGAASADGAAASARKMGSRTFLESIVAVAASKV